MEKDAKKNQFPPRHFIMIPFEDEKFLDSYKKKKEMSSFGTHLLGSYPREYYIPAFRNHE